MAVTLGREVLFRYRRFTLYNSPYVSHRRGCAIDLYPGLHPDRDTDSDSAVALAPENNAPSPVEGEVLDVRTVTAPSRPYAADHDHLILVDTGNTIARVLHVDPAVEPGDVVEVGDSLGTTIRSGYFAPWVDDHIHLGFREPGANRYRASGSVPLAVDVEVQALHWDGTGTVVETGDTYAVLDEPTHPAPGERFVGIECAPGVALDGGCPHYAGGGAFPGANGPVEIAGTRIGVAHSRDVTWSDLTVRANERPITGVSLFFARDSAFGAKLVCPDESFDVGEHVEVEVDAEVEVDVEVEVNVDDRPG